MPSIYDIALTRIDGSPDTLASFKGKVLLVVNVASKCGLTPQYGALEHLYETRHGDGLEVLGFPSNDFAGQEPGSDAEIAAFCTLTYQVRFPMFAKTAVVGEGQHPLYAALTAAKPQATGDGTMRARLKDYGISPNPPPAVLWNFEKFLVARDGQVLDRFAPDMPVDHPQIVKAIEGALAD